MIEEVIKIHDRHSAEIKVGFVARKKKKDNLFSFNIWMFLPGSLDINRHTYSKADFYRDTKSNIRLITPVYILRDIAEGGNSCFTYLEKSFTALASSPTRTHRTAYEYQIKMFLSILKSSLREEVSHISAAADSDLDYLVYNFIMYTSRIAERYRALYKIINVPTIDTPMMEVFRYGDEFMSNTIEFHCFRLIRNLKKRNPEQIMQQQTSLSGLIEQEISYRQEKNYPVASLHNRRNNNDLIYRLSTLKKYAESHLFLNVDKRKDGILIEQLLYSLAAGISMIFATVVAFSVQQKFGNLTMPLFVALVVSYMLKDRIKDFARYYFAHKLGSRYFDHKIKMKIRHQPIGWERESMDFISPNKVPPEISKTRNRTLFFNSNSAVNTEKVLLYRTRMYINRKKLDQSNSYTIEGVNSIIRFNVLQLMRNMDNAEFPLYCPDEKEGYQVVYGDKLYYINLVIQKQHDEQRALQRYRIGISRKGIQHIEKF
ncbi:MAG: hypothetical protein IAE96_08755 [Chitinophagaceae bacterium]|nr:hypothetical protein [Chitinophagaceae bacterium]